MGIGANSRLLRLRNSVKGDAGHWEFAPNELIFDESGVVRLISRQYEDGAVGNFKLMPKNKSIDQAIQVARSFLIPFGLSVLGSKVYDGKKRAVDHLTKWIIFSGGGRGITDIVFDPVELWNSAYFEVTTGELVFEDPITLTREQMR